jgi:hypothetical protein
MKRRTLFLGAFAALLTLNAVLLLVQPGLALPGSLKAYLLGPKMVKSEIVVKDGSGLHDYRLDQGKIRSIGPSSLTLLERTGEVVPIPVGPGTHVTLGGKTVSLATLRRGMWATTMREGGNAAISVQAARRK